MDFMETILVWQWIYFWRVDSDSYSLFAELIWLVCISALISKYNCNMKERQEADQISFIP